MALNEDLSRLMRTFHNREIDDLSLYVEGFGGFFISRTKDGMIIGYKDKNKRFGTDDHMTIFFDESGLKGLHRKVADAKTDVYMKYNVDYFQSSKGTTKLVQDMQKRTDVPLYMKMLLVVLYRVIRAVYAVGFKSSVRAKILENSEARKLGMKSPCIYVKPEVIEKLFLPQYGKIIQLQNLIHMFKFGEKTTKGFREKHFPGIQVTKHPKKGKRNSND